MLSTTFRPTLRSLCVASLPLALLLSLALLSTDGCKGGCNSATPNAPGFHSDYAPAVQQLLASPKLAMLRWPYYTDLQPQAQAFYNGRNNNPAWLTDGKPTPAATALLQLFHDAAQKGLNPEDYDAPHWPEWQQKLEQIQSHHDTSDAALLTAASFDAALTIDAMRYLSDLHEGRINPQTLNFDFDQPGKRAAFDLVALLRDKLVDAPNAANDIPAVAASLEPQNPLYRATEAALPKYLALAAQPPPAPLPGIGTAKPIDVGGSYPALAPLLTRLQLEGDAPASAPNTPAPTAYTADLAAAVKHYQQRHGLSDDGKLGQGTIDSLNVPMTRRVQQMNDALERWRWLSDDYVQPRILVNLPEFQLRAYEADHTQAFKMRVVDGEAHGNHDTPMFDRMMRYVVFRPYWNVPTSIIKKEIVPHLLRGGMGYLDKNGYEVTKSDGTIVTNASVSDISHLRYAIRQKPGPKNSLGLVKFLFPNEYDVYMHSTPELFLFNLFRRDRSHGCVRLQHADQMAVWVLQGDHPNDKDAWDLESVTHHMTDEDANNRTVGLKTPLPVVITYLTAVADEDGSMHFFNDIYGYDKQLEAALAKGRPYEEAPVKVNSKLPLGDTD
jgi:murein L,D-transpeptidase YcbB/YkuD